MRQTLLRLAFGALAAPLAAVAGEHPTLAIGSPAPDFRLPGVDGREYSLADFADAPVLAGPQGCASPAEDGADGHR